MLFAGIDIGGTSAKIGVIDASSGALVYTGRVPSGRIPPKDMAALLQQGLLQAQEAVQGQIAGTGVVCAGRIQPQTGIISAGNLDWWGVPFGEMLTEQLGQPVTLDNDVQGALFAEWRMGICRGVDNVVYVALGTGIGGALLINGRLYRGVNHEGAELGHIVTHADGDGCTCGGKGCWEVYASATALSRMACGIEPQQVFAAAEKGNARMKAVLTRYIHELAIGVSSLQSLFRPHMIVIGGGLSEAGEALLAPLRQELVENAPSIPRGTPPCIQQASLGNSAGMIGAALLAQDTYAKANP